MKQKKIFIAVIITAFTLNACQKSGTDLYRGYYSFKTGGYLNLTGKVYDIVRDTIKIDTTVNKREIGGRIFRDTTYKYHIKSDTIGSRDTEFVRYLTPESGQMHILGASGNNIKLTMNVTGGNPAVFDGTVSNDGITLLPIARQVGVQPEDDSDDDKISFLFMVGGTGRKYENMVLFDLEYRGNYKFDDVEGVITDSPVQCIATRNE